MQELFATANRLESLCTLDEHQLRRTVSIKTDGCATQLYGGLGAAQRGDAYPMPETTSQVAVKSLEEKDPANGTYVPQGCAGIEMQEDGDAAKLGDSCTCHLYST